MRLKRLLLLAPLTVVALLVQSYFWVPTYESQAKANPHRLRMFIESSIGDAKILNPILNADTASSRIVGLVFEGLLDLDDNLQLRGRLATHWEVGEDIYLLVNPAARFDDGSSITPESLLDRLRSELLAGTSAEDPSDPIRAIELLPPEVRRQTVEVPGSEAEGEASQVEVQLTLPPRIRFGLSRVVPDFLDRIRPIIGERYEQTLPRSTWVSAPAQIMSAIDHARLAEMLPVLEHNPTLVFHLRHGVRFHDGHEFDSDDVRFTYQAIMDPRNLSPRTSDFEPVKSVDILDRYTVRVVYKRLFSPAVNAWTMQILPEHLLNDEALGREMERRGLSSAARATFGMRESVFNRAPVGTGPFVFEQWQSDEQIRLRANQDYWEGAPEYSEYYYRVLPDPLTQEVEFRTGAVDIYAPQPHQIARYRDDDAYQRFSSLSTGYTYIGYNNRRALFQDRRVRQALSMAIDVDEIIRYVLYGEAERTTGPFPKNTVWYDPDVEPIPYDPEGARALLAEIGWHPNEQGWLEKDGQLFEFNLITNNGNLVRKAVVTIAQNAWRKIGIKCNTQLFEWAVFLEDFVNPGDFDAVVLGWSMGADPDLYQIWHSSQTGYGQLNFAGYRSPEADELIVAIREEYDAERQRTLTRRLHRVIAADQPYTFLYAPLATRVLDKKIVMVNPDGTYSRIPDVKSGDVFYSFNRWRKLDHVPRF